MANSYFINIYFTNYLFSLQITSLYLAHYNFNDMQLKAQVLMNETVFNLFCIFNSMTFISE